MASELITEIQDATFQREVLEHDKPVLVDFWATWCGPCKALSPVLEEMAKGYQGRLKVAKFNVEEQIDTPQKYGVTALPTLLFFHKGAVVQTVVGAPNRAKLTETIQRVLDEATQRAG